MRIYSDPPIKERKPSMPPDSPSPELTAIYERIENGITWLIEHDPVGAFNLWFLSRIPPYAPMPAHEADRREAYKAYFSARTTFDALWRRMEALEKAEAAA